MSNASWATSAIEIHERSAEKPKRRHHIRLRRTVHLNGILHTYFKLQRKTCSEIVLLEPACVFTGE